jgi:large subunit ribosomal protein L18
MNLTNFSRRKLRVRGKIAARNKGLRPKIVVFRSNKSIYAQLVSIEGKILTSFSTLNMDEKKSTKKSSAKETNKLTGLQKATLVGEKFAKLCLASNVKEVVFDKGAYNYNGRVKALADACRSAGLIF